MRDTIQEFDYYKSYKLKYKRQEYTELGLVGLENMGNTCFMNSILQCLSNTLELRDHFVSKEYIVTETLKRNQVSTFVKCFGELLKRMWRENTIIKPRSFKEILGKELKKYNDNNQQDSYECLEDILSLLENGIKYRISIDITGEIKTHLDKLLKESYIEWHKNYEHKYNYIVDLFDGMTYNKMKCNNCDYRNHKFEMYRGLTIELPFGSLEENLDEYFKETKIDDWKCEECKMAGGTKTNEIWTIPNYLIIHLKRFQCDIQTSKIHKKVTYPVESLDMTRYISKDKNAKSNFLYKLYAINCHTGEISDGHYWSIIRRLDNNWYIYNDMDTSMVSDTTNFNKKASESAYILFYYRMFTK